MRLIDADELLEHAYRNKLDSRELIVEMINNAPTVQRVVWIEMADGYQPYCGWCERKLTLLDHYCPCCGRELVW